MCVGVSLSTFFIPYHAHIYNVREYYQLLTSTKSLYFLGCSVLVGILGYIASEYIISKATFDDDQGLEGSLLFIPKIMFPLISGLFSGTT